MSAAQDCTSQDAWDDLARSWLEEEPQALWRRHADAVNRRLLERWLPAASPRVLKTDLFDDAVGEGVLPLLEQRAGTVFGLDISRIVVDKARSRYPELNARVADLRHLPFEDGFFDCVVSLSSLDHFASADAIEASLLGLFRVLRPGGLLILTLDNPTNPVLRLRAALPFKLLNGIGVMPYYCGPTLSVPQLAALLDRIGFRVLDRTAILHCPRVPAILFTQFLERWGSPRRQARLLDTLMRFEALERRPFKYVSGYFGAVLCMKAS
jgi:SAM-dependent methyltransferase